DKLVTGVQTCALPISPLKCGCISGCSSLHLFHTSTPCLSISRCSWFAILSYQLSRFTFNDLQSESLHHLASFKKHLTISADRPQIGRASCRDRVSTAE